jgi:hypothetical protein
MSREPQESRPLGTSANGPEGTPPLRETHSAGAAFERPAEALGAPWSAFIARILRPAPNVRREARNDL